MGAHHKRNLNLSIKTEEELFYIYCGYPKHYPKKIRYQAGRILENRDFQFKNITEYKKSWHENKLNNKHSILSIIISNFVAFLGRNTQGMREKENFIELSH